MRLHTYVILVLHAWKVGAHAHPFTSVNRRKPAQKCAKRGKSAASVDRTPDIMIEVTKRTPLRREISKKNVEFCVLRKHGFRVQSWS